MYFYNLYFFDKNVNVLIDSNQCFNGTLLMVPEVETFNRRQHYAGAFYWVNLKKIINYKKIGVIQNIELDNRYLAENFPGMFFKRDSYSSGLHSLDDKAFINEVYGLDSLFIGDDKHWDNIINILGYVDEFWLFYNKIINNL